MKRIPTHLRSVLLFAVLFVGAASFNHAQNVIPFTEYPFIYKYGWDNVGVENNGVVCEVNDFYNYNYQHYIPTLREAAYLQHTDTPLRVIGIATGRYPAVYPCITRLTLYDEDMTILGVATTNGLFSEYVNDTNHISLSLPGKTDYHEQQYHNGPTKNIVLRWGLFNQPIDFKGGGTFILGSPVLVTSMNTCRLSHICTNCTKRHSTSDRHS